MSRKQPDGHYLTPHLLDKAVREYKADGLIVREIPTPNWAFTAIKVPNGNILINCTYGHVVIEVDPQGKTVWQLSNADLPAPLIKDACGGQRLPNGNTVICSYGASGPGVKIFEVTPEKKVVWVYRSDSRATAHEVHVISTNGKPLEGPAMR